ncbi:heterokaryon incompatibility protein-domain-containing protein [Cladorrhinum samala]|uniref:Heterokaryon incompatibility protein-domain-containing protein n=1 Tax=Cladorrhinum samala TaxID=585594 RepID=A0AAV9HKV8_9PEZI|nr:heterokaryon incompatibility protein-domain-containing protein [Cladorrhinum samala]
MALCDRCQRFDIHEFSRTWAGFCGFPLRAICRSAQSGCSFCTLILHQLHAVSSQDIYEAITRPSSWGHSINPAWMEFRPVRGQLLGEETIPSASLNLKSLQIYGPVQHSEKIPLHMTITIHVAADEGTPAKTSNDVSGDIITSPLSLSDMPAIKARYEHCYKNHPACRVTLSRADEIDAKNTKLPARLIRVEFLKEKAGVELTLCETEGKSGTYIALSHRWDDHTFTSRTTKANYVCQQALCGHQRSDPDCIRATFPPLYHDAGLIAHNLGISYIWIDSVCIIQDDNDDWKKESVRMADYYQHAWLTIASTTTADDGGLLNMTPDPQDIPTIVQLPYRDKSGIQRGHFYAQASNAADVDEDYIRSVGNGCELRHRGWIFQEFILSRRLLTFSRRGVYMICQTEPPGNVRGDSVGRLEPGFVELPGDVGGILKAWEDLIEKYCALNFTKFEQDRVVALSGVANEFEKALRIGQRSWKSSSSGGVDFAYGHFFVWGEPEGPELCLRGLLWQEAEDDDDDAEPDRRQEKKPGRGRRLRALSVPTWSWASTAQRDEKGAVVGFRVKWYIHGQQNPKDENVARLKAISPAPAEILRTWDTLPPGCDPGCGFRPGPEYRDHSPLRALEIRGRLHECKIYAFFGSDKGRQAAAYLTYRNSETAPARTKWRAVALGQPSTHQYIIGWASVESAEEQDLGERRIPIAVQALFVRRMPFMPGGYGWGHWTDNQTAFEVLFLRPLTETPEALSGPPCYMRVGMGRLFGDEVESCYKAAKDTDIRLI